MGQKEGARGCKETRGARSPCCPGARGTEYILFSSRGSRVTVISHVEQFPFFLVGYLWILGAHIFFYFGFIIYISPLISTRVHHSQIEWDHNRVIFICEYYWDSFCKFFAIIVKLSNLGAGGRSYHIDSKPR